tara:strand:- start:6294 stop:6425 length:132 start_codon:yes stop_codon:yes gene_type:complete
MRKIPTNQSKVNRQDQEESVVSVLLMLLGLILLVGYHYWAVSL